MAFIAIFILGLSGMSSAIAATDPGLGAAASFSVLAQTAITGISTISGNVGLNSTGAGITALTAGDVTGAIYSTDGVAPSTAILPATVQADASTAYTTNIPGQGVTASIGPVLDGLTLVPGVYDIGAGRLNGGVLTLDGPGVYIFRASSDFVSSGSINFINGARACDVYWRVETLATINGSSFAGTILAGTGVHSGANVTLDGRALAIGGDVTMINDAISGPSCPIPPPPLPPPTPPTPPSSGGSGGSALSYCPDGTVSLQGIGCAVMPTTSTPSPTIPAPTTIPPTSQVLGTSTPTLPYTGSAPFPWNIALFTGITGIIALFMTVVFLRKRTI